MICDVNLEKYFSKAETRLRGKELTAWKNNSRAVDRSHIRNQMEEIHDAFHKDF